MENIGENIMLPVVMQLLVALLQDWRGLKLAIELSEGAQGYENLDGNGSQHSILTTLMVELRARVTEVVAKVSPSVDAV